MQCQNVLSTRWPVDLCACRGHLCFSSCGFFFGAVVDDVKSRLCLHKVQCCCVLPVWPSNDSFIPLWTLLLFSTLVCTFRYCSNCGLSCSLKFCVYLNMYTVRECVCGCSGDYFHTNTNRYLFLFCMIDTKAGASQLLMSDQVGCSRNIAVLPKLCSLWVMHCECVIRNAYYISSTGYMCSLPDMH